MLHTKWSVGQRDTTVTVIQGSAGMPWGDCSLISDVARSKADCVYLQSLRPAVNELLICLVISLVAASYDGSTICWRLSLCWVIITFCTARPAEWPILSIVAYREETTGYLDASGSVNNQSLLTVTSYDWIKRCTSPQHAVLNIEDAIWCRAQTRPGGGASSRYRLTQQSSRQVISLTESLTKVFAFHMKVW